MRSERLSMRRGLTLIELLVTVTVLSIAVALVIPSVSQTGVLRVQAAVRTIASDIAAAQTEAMAFQSRRAIYFGAVGWENVPDHISLWGLRLNITQNFDQWANVRPVKFLPGVQSPLRKADHTELDSDRGPGMCFVDLPALA